jgi:2Fe-2S ferredoxin
MLKVKFIEPGGAERIVEVEEGTSLMEAAVGNLVPGIDGDCGGQCACATCHVYVDEQWLGLLPGRSEEEASMLEFSFEPKEDSRLGCQIKMTDALDGITVTMPASQY